MCKAGAPPLSHTLRSSHLHPFIMGVGMCWCTCLCVCKGHKLTSSVFLNHHRHCLSPQARSPSSLQVLTLGTPCRWRSGVACAVLSLAGDRVLRWHNANHKHESWAIRKEGRTKKGRQKGVGDGGQRQRQGWREGPAYPSDRCAGTREQTPRPTLGSSHRRAAAVESTVGSGGRAAQESPVNVGCSPVVPASLGRWSPHVLSKAASSRSRTIREIWV